ncbi:unnamed protein product [Ostreobium quekettii]|uniref:Sin3 associated polypeptide p18 n=1 Tax=Ostreobium quekettii TaxID=121088 RepID=A0A8S1IXG8_9CHLO|nr:unnamed protein product [Ostreobium quekettii]|eukprot:evm.model.scf_618.7 EVM.evm.TU.scf_618.7   scf_618:52360-55375(-)
MASVMRAAAEAAADVGPGPPRRGPPGRPLPHAGSGQLGQDRHPAQANAQELDREKTCPLLLRVFPKTGGHHRLEDFAKRGQEPKGEVQIYTWPDANLRELTDLIKEVQVEARKPNTKLSFAFVYPDRKGRNVMRQVGVTHSSRAGEDDNKTLKALNFQTGDFLDIAIL